ncbi:hypothetical protein ACFQGT_01360 [Natrialbaceae archaeon GCM10025810]|uniref:DUF7344 domain-containing protein n=1 Tax=Halovalidus salilacus TaxID=3075124 RepID=UPI00361EDE1F
MIPLISDPESLAPFVGPSSAGTDSAFRLLGHRHRRSVLRHLASHEGTRPVALSDLAVRIALEDRRGDVTADGSVSTGDRRTIELSLRHTHLPMLSDAGAIEYDHRKETASLTEEGRTLLDRSSAIRGSFG